MLLPGSDNGACLTCGVVSGMRAAPTWGSLGVWLGSW
jgi:hypothetical protein